MKRKLLTSGLQTMSMMTLMAVFLIACKEDDEKPKMAPELTTSPITDITPNSAKGGGEIKSDGNVEITASGLVYSSTNNTPTLSDNKTEGIVTDGKFTSSLLSLTPDTKYYVRAYATNSVGTGYGDLVSFTSGNAAPTVTNVSIIGIVDINAVLTATYSYNDAEGDTETGTAFQWYRATEATGAGETAIQGATSASYTILPTDEFAYIRVGVTPKAGVGATLGMQVKSAFTTQVPEAPETITFTYMDIEVTYGIITSSATGRKWMDRNLGAKETATSTTDFNAYGDLFQRGRLADGHQSITWASSTEGTPISNTTTTIATADVPATSDFILRDNASSLSYPDWRNPQKTSLWQSPDFINNPCPTGWHIPTNTEWAAENLSIDEIKGTNHLKLAASGNRRTIDGALRGTGSIGYYWSADMFYYQQMDINLYHALFFNLSDASFAAPAENAGGASLGQSCRCIKNQ
jgi:hypothetical protein